MDQRYVRHSVGSVIGNNDSLALGRSKTRTDTPALPFCHCLLKAKKPRDPRYPTELRTIGDRLRGRRMDLGLRQKDVAKLLGVTEDSVCYWENGRVRPSRSMLTKLIEFFDRK